MEMGILMVFALMIIAVFSGLWLYFQFAAFEAKKGAA
jgi:hypothetical protein